jgi:WD40 repeat protein
MPEWEKKAHFFIVYHKNFLEEKCDINKWMDLIFGNKQTGKLAEENYNIFLNISYDKCVDLNKLKDNSEEILLYIRLYELGKIPKQLLIEKQFPNRLKDKIEIKYEYNNFNYDEKSDFYKKLKKIENYPIKILKVQKDEILFLYNKYILKFKIKLKEFINIHIDKNYSTISFNLEELQLKNLYYSKYNNKQYLKNTFISYNNYIILGGFFSGKILFSKFNKLNKKNNQIELEFNKTYINNYDNSIVTVIKTNSDFSFAYVGTKKGSLIIYKITETSLIFKKQINDHYLEILDININNNLQMIATSSYDNYINLYTLPKCKLVHNIKLNLNEYANKIFLSNSPLPCIVTYFIKKKEFKVFTINGKEI